MAEDQNHELHPEEFNTPPVNPSQRPDLFPTTQEGPKVAGMYASGELRLPAMTFNAEEGTDPTSKAALDQINAAAHEHNRQAGAHNAGVVVLSAEVDATLQRALDQIATDGTAPPDQNGRKQ